MGKSMLIVRGIRILATFSFVVFCLLSPLSSKASSVQNLYGESALGPKDTIGLSILHKLNNDVFIVKDIIDLKGKTLVLPNNSILRFKGGMLQNGIVVGENTTLVCSNKDVVFNRVNIKGIWRAPSISTSMFMDLSYDNSLKDVIALTSPNIKNTVVIEKGAYIVSALKQSDACLHICSNTTIQLEGDIVLTPNGFHSYSIVRTEGANITLTGIGRIIGDKDRHLSEEGEWGMGVYIDGGHNISLKGITVKNCWGDCVYITKEASRVRIKECTLANSRRQGISVISASDLRIERNSISGISGTLPGYAIDVEPNKSDTVNGVFIKNNRISKCRGGVLVSGRASDSSIDNVNVNKCVFEQIEVCPLNIRKANRASVINCVISSSKNRQDIICENLSKVSVRRIRINKERVDVGVDRRVYIDESIKNKVLN